MTTNYDNCEKCGSMVEFTIDKCVDCGDSRFLCKNCAKSYPFTHESKCPSCQWDADQGDESMQRKVVINNLLSARYRVALCQKDIDDYLSCKTDTGREDWINWNGEDPQTALAESLNNLNDVIKRSEELGITDEEIKELE